MILLPLALVGVVVVYILILAKRYVDAKVQESKASIDLYTKMAIYNESLDRIEKKLDKIDSLLEKKTQSNM